MTEFVLDKRLGNDCIELGMFGTSSLLLMNNALVPWFIIVPHTSEIELIDLPEENQQDILQQINLLSGFIKNNFDITKLNTAAIGNIVSQLHIHVVGRSPSDYCWPNVVWGTTKKEVYNNNQIASIVTALKVQLSKTFKEKEQGTYDE